MKMYPDHCIFMWGEAFIDDSKLAVHDWNRAMPFEEIDRFEGKWGFDEAHAEGTFQIN